MNNAQLVAKLERDGLSRIAALKAVHHPRSTPSVTTPSRPVTGFAHPKCYAGALNDCSEQISREHYFSESVLELIGNSIEVSGMPWQQESDLASLSPASLAAKHLCERHNHALSPLDSCAKELFATLREIDANLADDATLNEQSLVVLNGSDVERWFLKCLFGIVKVPRNDASTMLRDELKCLRVLFGEATWPAAWGLYADVSKSSHAYDGLSATTRLNQGEVWAATFNVAGSRFVLALGKAEGDVVYRPAGLRFRHADRPGTNSVVLTWSEPPYSDYISSVRSKPYEGEPIDRY